LSPSLSAAVSRPSHQLKPSVSPGILEVAADAPLTILNTTPVLSAERSSITLVPRPALLEIGDRSSVRLYDIRSSVINRIVTPYNPDAFSHYLSKFNLISSSPNLVKKLCEGFPLGTLCLIPSTFTPPNHPSALEFHNVVHTYLLSERDKGRMSGPYSCELLEDIIGGPFRSSPVQVVLKGSKPRMVINLSFKGSSPYSINDMIDSDDFPTCWGGACEVEQIVCSFFRRREIVFSAFLRSCLSFEDGRQFSLYFFTEFVL